MPPLTKAALLDAIEAAFGSVAHPGWKDTWESPSLECSYEYEELEREIPEGMHWRDISVQSLRGSSFLLLVVPRAFPYVAAAYLWKLIDDPEELDAGCDVIVDWDRAGFLPTLAAEQMASLTDDQYEVMIECAKYRAADPDFFNAVEFARAIPRWMALRGR